MVRLLAHFDENMNEIVNKYYPVSSYQSGYLTIKDWNMDTNSYLLDFPNDEVKHGFLTLIRSVI